MKLFIDTSNKKLILAIINIKNKIVAFLTVESNNDMVKIAIPNIDKFLKANNYKLQDFDEFMFVIGPGSFTGVKVAYNIIGSINIVKKINKFYTISSFGLITPNKNSNVIIPFGKNKFYLKKKNKQKIEIIKISEIDDLRNFYDGYLNFDEKILQEKIDNKKFTIHNDFNKITLKYL